MKRFLSLALLFAILLSFAAVPTEAAESDLRFRLHSLDIVLTPNRTLKIGEAPSDPDRGWTDHCRCCHRPCGQRTADRSHQSK